MQITQADVDRIVRNHIELARQLGHAVIEAGGTPDVAIYDGAIDQAKRTIQRQPGGEEAWRDYMQAADYARHRVRLDVSQGRMNLVDSDKPISERARTGEYVLRYDDAGNVIGVRLAS